MQSLAAAKPAVSRSNVAHAQLRVSDIVLTTANMNKTLILLVAGLCLIAPRSLWGVPGHVTFAPSATTVDAFDFLAVTLNVAAPDAANPFTDVTVRGEFAPADRTPMSVDGFCDAADGSVFQIRFMPAIAGPHTCLIIYRQGDFTRTHNGTFTARDAKRRGQLRVDPEYPEHFVWAGTGEHYFWNGTTTYYLMGWEDDAVIGQAIDRLAAFKINRLRVLVYGRNNDRPWGQPVRTTADFKLYLNPWPAVTRPPAKPPIAVSGSRPTPAVVGWAGAATTP